MPTLFIKLGGSLITNKDHPRTARMEVIQRLAMEIAVARKQIPDLRMIIGHGSGSFGHMTAARHDTVHGVHTPGEWIGFAEVWKDAHSLNQIFTEALQNEGLPAIVFSPSASILVRAGKIIHSDIRIIQSALENGLLPVVHGDVVFDTLRGGTILATEDIFYHLALNLNPHRILLAGEEEGVWEDYPTCTKLVKQITPKSFKQISSQVKGSASVDVTGGMAQKVSLMIKLVKKIPHLEALIFSAEKPGRLLQAIAGENPGTLLTRNTIG